MAVTPPYKIALSCSAATLLVAAMVRWQSSDATALLAAADPPTDTQARTPSRSPDLSTDKPVDEAPPFSDTTNGTPTRATTQAPSKPPPALRDAAAVPNGEADQPDAETAWGSDAGDTAAGSLPAEASQAPPTLTVGRGPDAARSDAAGLKGASPASLAARADPGEAGDPGDEALAAGDPLEASAAAEATQVTDPAEFYVVRSGDTFEAIARRELGSPARWVALAQANPTVNPLKLRVGDQLRLPPMEGVLADENRRALNPNDPENATLPPPPDAVTYVVRSGDSLSTISARYYGDSSRWQAIFNANRDQLQSPHAVRAGMQLRIPPAIAAAPGSVSE